MTQPDPIKLSSVCHGDNFCSETSYISIDDIMFHELCAMVLSMTDIVPKKC